MPEFILAIIVVFVGWRLWRLYLASRTVRKEVLRFLELLKREEMHG